MRYPAAYYLLLLYSTVLMRCALPVACDALSHVFNEENHIATVHAVYGNNHVEKEIASGEKDSNKNQAGIKYEDQVPFHLSTEAYIYTAFTPANILLSSGFQVKKPGVIFISKHVPPPKFS